VVDLGDVRLEPSAVLVGGVVVDQDGAPVAGADVTCGLVPAAGAAPVWRPDLVGVSGADGTFAVHGDEGVPALRLAVDRPGHLPVRDLAVVPGTRELRVVLARVGGGSSR
jgi:hypothetical protein